MPDPTTIATRKAVPTSSAVARRARSRSIAGSAAAVGGFRGRGTTHRVLAGGDRPQLSGRHLDVGEDGVDLPRLAVGTVDPDLVLHCIAARDFVLGCGRQ